MTSTTPNQGTGGPGGGKGSDPDWAKPPATPAAPAAMSRADAMAPLAGAAAPPVAGPTPIAPAAPPAAPEAPASIAPAAAPAAPLSIPNPNAPPPAPAPAAATPAAPAAPPQAISNDLWAKATTEFLAQSSITAETRAEFVKAGIANAQIDGYLFAMKGAKMNNDRIIRDAFGSAEAFNAARDHALATLPKEEQKLIFGLMSSPDPVNVQAGSELLASRTRAAVGASGATFHSPAAGGQAGFADTAEEDRYTMDPRFGDLKTAQGRAYTKYVSDRMARSAWNAQPVR